MEDRLYRYCAKLISRIYIILVIFEGKSFEDRTKFCTREEAFDNYQKNLIKLQIEINGCVVNYPHIIEFEEMKNILTGLKDIQENEHDILRPQIFNLIDICKKIQVNYQNSEEE